MGLVWSPQVGQPVVYLDDYHHRGVGDGTEDILIDDKLTNN